VRGLRSTYGCRRRRRTSTQDTAYAKLYATYVVANGHNCVATATAGYAQGRSQDFTLVATEAERRRPQNFTVLNKASPTSQQSQFFPKKIHSIDGWGTWPHPPLATTLATQRNTLRRLPYSDAVCVNAATVSALLMTLPRTGWLLTVRLLPWDTQVSKHASVLMLQRALPPHPRRPSAGDVMPPSLVVPSVGTTNDAAAVASVA